MLIQQQLKTMGLTELYRLLEGGFYFFFPSSVVPSTELRDAQIHLQCLPARLSAGLPRISRVPSSRRPRPTGQ